MKIKRILAVVLLGVSTFGAKAKIILPNVFSNGMVLQQKSNAAIWGKSVPGLAVNITTSWNKKSYKVKVNADSTWRIKVETPKAGGPYDITISDGAKLILKDVLIGEVWFISGQSNMEMGLRGRGDKEPILGGPEAIANANNDKIRFFRSQRVAWGTLQDNLKGRWQVADPKSSPLFSALGYFFALKLQNELKVPVGIIQVAYGGTPIEAWMSKDSLTPFANEVKIPEEANQAVEKKGTPTVLFNGMINPMVGYTLKGMLWYQGEQNRRYPALYAKLFPVMVADWRKRWDNGEFPFYYVQIAPYGSPESFNAYTPFLREAQLKSTDVIPNAGMVTNIDLGTVNSNHPPYKEKIADRMLPLVLTKTYGYKNLAYQGPKYRSITIKGNKANLFFDYAENGLKFSEENVANFEVAGDNQQFYPATSVKIKGYTIEVISNDVKKPVAVRYAFKAWVVGNLYNTEGFPASSFRTDNWEIPQ
ncbi:sialate O-acetylesterase [uncultured Pedobacter sp.]|uniref:sialate O-acetylesterase n=1 Tax=uncultured Pedobacter sp. TaxID=246139 RepID=UPI00262127A2|nr:sialate O-acetylesterase [uncultured Pedobacter sp.]